MLFEVVRDNKVYMSTEEPSYIPYNDLDSMQKSGYKFKLDGRVISASQLKSRNSTPAKVTECKAVEPKVTSSTSTTTKRKVRRVYCKQTDTIYKNMSEAGRALGLDPAAVSYAIQVNRPTTSGYTFSIVGDDE